MFLSSSTDKQLNLKAVELATEYNEDLTSDLAHEILSLHSALKPAIKTRKSIKEIAELLFVENHLVACSVSDVCTDYLLFLTLPVLWLQTSKHFKIKVDKKLSLEQYVSRKA